ncbi:family 10 glycosylhydrolase [Candidatus Sumerlaeota bacterium]|nr:family 10 glycosylhydrolase [Candidatus Sumerlaeales bacterium]NLD61131.1 family 10 glycosylhydrolase [Candidatus Sumerlaeota bacterium]
MPSHGFIRYLLLLCMICADFASPRELYAQNTNEEYRMAWVTRLEWPNADQTKAKTYIDNCMSSLAANNFNAVLFQVRGQCDVHYPSPDEPWATTYQWKNPGWNPLQYALEAAHKNGLEFHAYINTHVMSRITPPAETTPQHLYNLHGPNAKGDDCWLIHDRDGNPVKQPSSGYLWMSPGHPEASLWTRRQILYVVNNYTVDGVHLDRVRTPTSYNDTYSHDPVTVRRFYGEGNPDGVGWGDFMRRQITDDLRRIYGQIAMTRPKCKMSATPLGALLTDETSHHQGYGNAYRYCYQDGYRWVKEGCLDFVVPQIYYTGVNFQNLLADWLERTDAHRPIVAGSATDSATVPIEELLWEYRNMRSQGASGWSVYSYSSIGTYLDAIKQQFAAPAPVPSMPWKTSPTCGILTGTVRDAEGNPLTDACVVLADDTLKNASGTAPYNHLTGADGFYAILNVPAGTTHTLTFSKWGKASVVEKGVIVRVGKVTNIDAQFTNVVPEPTEDPEEIIIETYDSAGVLNTNYSEELTTSSQYFGRTVAKSTAPGLIGSGARYIGTGGQGASGVFRPRLTAAGNYNIYVTLSSGSNNVSPGVVWDVVTDKTSLTSGTVDLSYTNAAVVNKWYKLAGPVSLPRGSYTCVRLTNTNPNSSNVKGRMSMDAVKFEPVPKAKVGEWVEYGF